MVSFLLCNITDPNWRQTSKLTIPNHPIYILMIYSLYSLITWPDPDQCIIIQDDRSLAAGSNPYRLYRSRTSQWVHRTAQHVRGSFPSPPHSMLQSHRQWWSGGCVIAQMRLKRLHPPLELCNIQDYRVNQFAISNISGSQQLGKTIIVTITSVQWLFISLLIQIHRK